MTPPRLSPPLPADLLNLRGSDIVYNPVFFSYCVVLPESVHLFIDAAQLSAGVTQHFAEEGAADLQIHGYEDVWSFLKDKVRVVRGNGSWLGLEITRRNRSWLTFFIDYGNCMDFYMMVQIINKCVTSAPGVEIDRSNWCVSMGLELLGNATFALCSSRFMRVACFWIG